MQSEEKGVAEQNKYKTIFKQIKELQLWNDKARLCKHPRGCITHILYYSVRNFAMGYSIQTALNLIFLIMRFKKINLIGLIKALIAKNSFDSGIFAMLFIVIQKIVFCSSRRIFKKENGISCFLAGFLAGLISLSYKSKGSRANWSLFLLSRSIDCIYTSQVKNKYKVKFDYTLMFCILNVLPGYSFAVEPSLISKGLYNFYQSNMNFDKGDAGLKNIWMKQKNIYFRQMGFEVTNMKDFEIKY